MRLVFWSSLLALAWTHVGYGLALAGLRRLRPRAPAPLAAPAEPPRVSLIVAAYNEEAVIAGKVADALALDWPRDRLELIVAVDGSTDTTAARARTAGADLVLELPRGGKVRAQDAAVRAASGELLAFSDANARWAPDALRRLAAAFADPHVGYACGRVSFINEGGTNQEGLYWRYELWLRGHESALASVTAGNGAIYAVRPAAYIEVDPVMGHDLSLPFNLVKRGWRAVEVDARATEKMVPSLEGEWRRKRRMMSHTWPILLRGGLLDPRGYPPLYAGMVFSHRVLRYASPFLHLALAATSIRRGRIPALALLSQAALLGGAAAAPRRPARTLLVARYYVLTTAAIAAGLYDWARHGTPVGWDAAEGTR
jgi:cellulose synthase/poly-beta-1,6-N-acetylglucosamine synthase-like glycosyltransferase